MHALILLDDADLALAIRTALRRCAPSLAVVHGPVLADDRHPPAGAADDPVAIALVDGRQSTAALVDACRRLRQSVRSIHAVIVAVIGEGTDLEAILPAGADDVLLVPATDAELHARLGMAWHTARRRLRGAAIPPSETVERMERAVREADNRFRATFYDSPLPSCIGTLDTGRIVAVNRAFENLLDTPREELIGREMAAAGLWGTVAEREDLAKRLTVAGSIRDWESTIHTPRQGPTPVHVWIEVVEFDGAPCMLVKLLDIAQHKHTERALARLADRWSHIFHRAPIALNLTRLTDGVIVDANETFARMAGWPLEEMIGKTTRELQLWPPNTDRDSALDQWLSEGAAVHRLGKMRRRDGDEFEVSFSVDRVEIDGVPHVFSALIDVTEQKRAERALRESEERFATAFREAPIALTITTLDEGTFVEVNDTFVKRFGIPREQAIGRSSVELGLIASTDERAKLVAELRSHGTLREIQLSTPFANGHMGHTLNSFSLVRINGEPHALTTSVDITERVRAEEALRESEQRFATTFHRAPVAMVISNPATGEIIDVNGAFERLTGWSREAVVGRKATEINGWRTPEEREAFIARLQREARVSEAEMQVFRQDGTLIDVLASAEIVEMHGERCMLTVAIDITARKRAENALRELEMRFAAAFYQAPVGILIGTPGAGRIVDCNDTCAQMIGVPREALIGQYTSEFGLWGTAGDIARIAAQLGKTGVVRDVESDFVNRAGQQIHTRTSFARITIGGEMCMLGVILDISEQKRNEHVLRESETRFRTMADSAPVMIWLCDRQGNVSFVNRGWLDFTGRTLEMEVGRGWLDAVHPADCVGVLARIAAAGGGEFEAEFRLRRADGEFRWVMLRGTAQQVPIDLAPGIVASGVDITERKRIEEALRQSEERFATAFRHAPMGMAILVAGTGRFVDANQHFLEMFGRTREGLVGQTARALDLGVDFDFDATAGPVSGSDARYRTANGEWRDMTVTRARISIGDEPCIFVIVEDTTERHRLEKQVIEISRQEQQRIGRDLHDGLGQHLAGVAYMSKVLSQHLSQREAAEADRAERITRLLYEALEQTRSLSRILSPLEAEETSLVPALRSLAENVGTAFGVKCQFATECDAGVPITVADRFVATHLYRIAQEAVNNAAKHSGATALNVRMATNSTYLVLTITDDGGGFEIPPADEPNAGGLGIAVMRYRARMIGARIAIDSAPGHGTTVTCELPLSRLE